jgi:hypothetical protein
LPALARSAALSLRPGPNPLAFPGLVVAAARDVGPVDDARVEDLRRRLSALAYSTQANRS